MDPSTEYLKFMSKEAERIGPDAIHNPVPKGVSKAEHAKVLRGVKKKKNVDNPYALTNWITQHN